MDDKPIIQRAFPMLCGENPHILILGTFPSPLSRQTREYYGNPRNQFWRLIFGIFNEPFNDPVYEKKKAVLFNNAIALCDVVLECEPEGALDTGIRNPVYNTDLPMLIAEHKISMVFFNGNNAYLYYHRGIGEIERQVLPSSSPANARIGFEEKLRLWSELLS